MLTDATDGYKSAIWAAKVQPNPIISGCQPNANWYLTSMGSIFYSTQTAAMWRHGIMQVAKSGHEHVGLDWLGVVKTTL